MSIKGPSEKEGNIMTETKIRDDYKWKQNSCVCGMKQILGEKNFKGRERIMQYEKTTMFMQFSLIGKRQEMINDKEDFERWLQN